MIFFSQSIQIYFHMCDNFKHCFCLYKLFIYISRVVLCPIMSIFTSDHLKLCESLCFVQFETSMKKLFQMGFYLRKMVLMLRRKFCGDNCESCLRYSSHCFRKIPSSTAHRRRGLWYLIVWQLPGEMTTWKFLDRVWSIKCSWHNSQRRGKRSREGDPAL